MLKVYIAPSKGQMFRRTPKPSKPAQGKQQTPFSVGAGFQYFVRHFACHKELASLVGLLASFHVGKRILRRHFPSDGLPEHLAG
ncbi:MAG TPA: hypothetical protein VL992_03550 [Tepidisphaeraceae bacterium]|nr:hypothetical protein [Tepidisphaeraceae bacterium]